MRFSDNKVSYVMFLAIVNFKNGLKISQQKTWLVKHMSMLKIVPNKKGVNWQAKNRMNTFSCKIFLRKYD